MTHYIVSVISLLFDCEDYEAADDLVAGYVTAVLREKGYSVSIIEIEQYNENIGLSQIINLSPNIVIFTIPRTSNISEIINFSHYIKSNIEVSKIILTGWSHHSAPLNVEYILKNYSDIDIIINGEGEVTVKELVEIIRTNGSLYSCDGISFSDNGKIITTKARKQLENLNLLPFPARDTHKNHNFKTMWISSARGCLGNCSFCSVPATRPKHASIWRGRSPEDVVTELKYLHDKYKIKQFNFLDPTFEDPGVKGKNRIHRIAELIIDANLDITFLVHMRAENWSNEDENLLNTLFMAGLESVIVGIEAGNNSCLNLYNKRASLEDNIRFVKLINKFNINIDCGFIMFHPYSTMENIIDNATFLHDLGLADCTCPYSSRLDAFPNTALYDKIQKDNLVLKTINSHNSQGYSLYDYKYKDPVVKRLSDKMLYVNNFINNKKDVPYKQVMKLTTYLSRTKRLIARKYKDDIFVINCYSCIEKAINDMKNNMNHLNHSWFLNSIELVKNNVPNKDFNCVLKKHLNKIENEILPVQKIQMKYGLKLTRHLHSLAKF
jgi:anaerobic magnesium-protoporphyrin IX monomethyl ester cyclase